MARESGTPVSAAALGELLKRLRVAAVDGVVPEREFTQGVNVLGLDDVEQARLRTELARMGLLVRELHAHVEVDSHSGEKVVCERGESVTPRVRLARALLSRYQDDAECVSSRAVEGVVRLAGLDAREAAVVRAGASVRPAADTDATGDGGVLEEPHGTPAVPTGAEAAVVPEDDLAGALAAAREVLEADRFERGSHKRLLSAQAEVGLTVLVRGGVDRIAQEPGEDELKALPRDDIRVRARDCLVLHNLRLVHSLARPQLHQGLDYDDLVQHGVLGLIRATRKFDPTMGNKFSTYATWWIRQSITRAVADEGALIRIPVHMHEQMRRVAKAERALAAEGRYASAADVAVRCDMTVQKVEEIRRLTRRTDSLDRVIGDGATLGDFVARTRLLPPVDQQVIDALFADEVLGVVDTFTEREARILVRRLGLDGDEPSTLDDLGREFGVTRERIRQIEGKMRPVLRERVRAAGLVGLDAVCEEAERAAERVAEAKRTLRYVRATHQARAARARGVEEPVRAGVAERSAKHDGARIEEAEPETTVVAVEEDAPAQEMAAVAMGAVAAELTADREVPSVTESPADTEAPDVIAADWEGACRLAQDPVDQAGWLAEYARTAVGDAGLVSVLGQSAADMVVRNVRDGEPVSRPVLTALELLRRVFDAVAAAGRTPEDFFGRPAPSLRGVTPRAYLECSPLVNGEARLAVRDSLREFLAAVPPTEEPEAAREVSERAAREPAGEQSPEVPPERAAEARETEQPQPQPAAKVEPESEPEPAMTRTRTRTRDAERPVRAPQTTADWEKARTLTQPPLGGGVAWLAEYALLALGHPQLSVLLGPSATDGVVRAARQRGTLDRPVVEALEVLKEICDAVKHRALRPERFLERSADALAGATPRTYLAAKPLVRAESRLAVREALREFVVARPVHTEPTPSADGAETGTSGSPAAGQKDPHPASADAVVTSAEQTPADVEELLAEARARHQADAARLAREHEHRLDQERRDADRRVAAVRAEAERRLDALEEELLLRADRSRDRHAQHVRRQTEERLAHLKAQHREAYEAVLRRAELAEEAARQAAGTDRRAGELEQRMREYREGAEARIADLEARLRQTREAAAGLEARLRRAEESAIERERAAASARDEYRQGAQVRIAEVEARLREAEAALAQRELFVEAARRSAEETEQRAAQRIAQSEHDAWLRITDLQAQLSDVQAELAAAQAEEAARNRSSLRDRWRRS